MTRGQTLHVRYICNRQHLINEVVELQWVVRKDIAEPELLRKQTIKHSKNYIVHQSPPLQPLLVTPARRD